MSTDTTRREQIAASLRDKEYRDAFVADHIDTGLAFQIRATREARGWSQKDLGRRAGMAQERVSVLEDPDYGKLTVTTLKRLASAFDTALVVRFVPFSQLVDWATDLSPESLAVPDFEHDHALSSAPGAISRTSAVNLTLPQHATEPVSIGKFLRTNLGRMLRPKQTGTATAVPYRASTTSTPVVAVHNV